MSDLTDKQKLFIDNYLIHFNATRAAKEAGYSEDTAAAIGWENLRKPEIKAEIEKVITEIMEMDRNELSYRIITELKDIAFAENNGDEVITNHDGDIIGVNKRDRLKALELLGKYRSLFVERIEHSGSLTVDNTVFVVETSEIS